MQNSAYLFWLSSRMGRVMRVEDGLSVETDQQEAESRATVTIKRRRIPSYTRHTPDDIDVHGAVSQSEARIIVTLSHEDRQMVEERYNKNEADHDGNVILTATYSQYKNELCELALYPHLVVRLIEDLQYALDSMPEELKVKYGVGEAKRATEDAGQP